MRAARCRVKHVITGPFPIDVTCSGKSFAHPAPNPYAHRCHPITGLTPGDSIQFRWGSTADWVYEFEGFYLDDVAVTNVRLPNACVPNTCPGQANGTGCDDGDACTINDACSAGSCAGTPITAPAETQHVRVEADKTFLRLGSAAELDELRRRPRRAGGVPGRPRRWRRGLLRRLGRSRARRCVDPRDRHRLLVPLAGPKRLRRRYVRAAEQWDAAS